MIGCIMLLIDKFRHKQEKQEKNRAQSPRQMKSQAILEFFQLT